MSMVAIKNTAARPEISILRRGRMSFTATATTAGTTSRKPARSATSCISIIRGQRRTANTLWPASTIP